MTEQAQAAFETHQEHRENGLLDFAMDRGKKIAAAVDYIEMALTIPMDEEAHAVLTHIEAILKGKNE